MSDQPYVSTLEGFGGRPPDIAPEVTRRIRIEWKPQDFWIGVFWKRAKWWSGVTDEWQDAALAAGQSINAVEDHLAHFTLDLWICLLPMVPIHYRRTRCPRPDRCTRDHTDWNRES